MKRYDLVIVGAGHAGCEAALTAARMGVHVLLIGLNLTRVAHMVCNPSIGGPGKAHLVSEIDALGGAMGEIIDASYLQVRILNSTKGVAVQGLRAQADKKLYQKLMKDRLEATPNLDLSMEQVKALLVENGEILGVRFFGERDCFAKKVIVSTGVYLDSRIVMGEARFTAGPAGGITDNSLSLSLQSIGFEIRRLQTATPSRLRSRSINFDVLEKLPFDPNIRLFSPDSGQARADQLPCHIIRTGKDTVEAVRRNLPRSPLVIGNIVNNGPRYCPSIDRKVINFPDKFDHAVFIEPEGSDGFEVYLQGLSSAMPPESQLDIIHSLQGLEEAEVSRFGYGIEYDYVPPYQLKNSLETHIVKGLYFAGQINGTSGYEEAAAQGLVAAINAVRSLSNKKPLILPRHLSYIGIMIDDLVTKEHLEPYRMLTSRAEFRLRLSQESAHFRLTPIAWRLGLVNSERHQRFQGMKRRIFHIIRTLKKSELRPTPDVLAKLEEIGSTPIRKLTTAFTLLKRNEISLDHLVHFGVETPEVTEKEKTWIERIARYTGYLAREETKVREVQRLSRFCLPTNYNYSLITTMSKESRDSLNHYKPENVAQASRLQGITPADLTNLLLWLNEHREEIF